MENSAISWCDHTQNFWIGCTKVSPGCANCYAETLDRNRFSKTLGGGTKEAPVSHWGPGAPRHRTGEGIWADPMRWDKAAKAGHFVEIVRFEPRLDAYKIIARGDSHALAKQKDAAGAWLIQDGDKVFKVRPRVFCSSLSDILDPEVDVAMLAEALDVIRKCDGLDWLLLTKRPALWREQIISALFYARHVRPGMDALADWLDDWLSGHAPAHVWFGATMEDQPRYDQRWRALAAIPARYRFISMEPMLGPIDMLASMPVHSSDEGTQSFACPFHWVIVGGESGDGARPMHPEWAKSIHKQCAQLGVPFHFKQWGAWVPRSMRPDAGCWFLGDDKEFADIGGMARSQNKNFHLLDGVEYRAFPNDPCARDHDRDGNCDVCHKSGGCFYSPLKGGSHA